MKLFVLLAAALTLTPAYGAALKFNNLIKQRLSSIDKLIHQQKYPEAIKASLDMFSLDASACRGIDTHEILAKDGSGNPIIAQTRLNQIIVLDPNQIAFKNARYLVTTLAQEIAHCEQNQKMYAVALAHDKVLSPLKDKVTYLRYFADLDEIASVAVKSSSVQAQAIAQFKSLAAKYKLTLTPEEFTGLTAHVVDDIQLMQRTMGDLNNMESALKAFEVPGVLPAPVGKAKASPEFAFNLRYLLISTNQFMQMRQLFGADPKTACQVINFVPYEFSLQHERNCNESINLLRQYGSQT